MVPNGDPDRDIVKPIAAHGPLYRNPSLTERHAKDIIVQGLSEKYGDIQLTTTKNPDVAEDPGNQCTIFT